MAEASNTAATEPTDKEAPKNIESAPATKVATAKTETAKPSSSRQGTARTPGDQTPEEEKKDAADRERIRRLNAKMSKQSISFELGEIESLGQKI